jgi:DEAD/DEAH box helicase domain-containing protein
MHSEIETLLGELHDDPAFRACVTSWEKIPARSGKYRELPASLDPGIKQALAKKGITRLYSHQYECYMQAAAGKNIVVVTPTASGKTLCYNLPVLEALLKDPAADMHGGISGRLSPSLAPPTLPTSCGSPRGSDTSAEPVPSPSASLRINSVEGLSAGAGSAAKALYLFPTKALSQDQQSELNEIVLEGKIPIKIATYDGDTPQSVRVAIRDSGRIVISNPDMLHTGVLPNHPKWIKFLKNLRFIVIDEMHTYRGVFGSHMTNVVRRLKRIVNFYGSKPQFILCSATIGNPKELAERIIEEEVMLIDDNGAPSGERHLIFYNPPLVDPVQGIRRGVVNESQRLALRFLQQGIKTIVFARSRVRTELIASYINGALANLYTDNARIRVESYRGGYLPNERRAIEQGLRSGAIQGVVSTNALELGIDIGGLDASILAGFPGSIASTWQQAGRAGRRQTVSVSLLIASSSPLNQYVVNHPEYFLSKSPESGFIDPNNMYIELDHLKCAVFELPFADGEQFSPRTPQLLAYLEEQGVIRHTGGAWYWADRSYPAEQISLRSATSENVVIVDTTAGKNSVIGEMDRPSAKELIFDNAIYLHRGEQYVVKKLDIENKRCEVEQADVNYYTDAIVKTDIKVLHEDERESLAGTVTVLGDILVRTQATKYKKLRFHTHENIGYGEIYLTPEEMHTRSLVILFNEATDAGGAFAKIDEAQKPAVIARLGFLIKNVAPVFLLCDANDIGVSEKLKDPHFSLPCLYVYDKYPGGTGLSEGFREKLNPILRALRERVATCPCGSGCPSCIGPIDAHEPGGAGDLKKGLSEFLRIWTGT